MSKIKIVQFTNAIDSYNCYTNDDTNNLLKLILSAFINQDVPEHNIIIVIYLFILFFLTNVQKEMIIITVHLCMLLLVLTIYYIKALNNNQIK